MWTVDPRYGGARLLASAAYLAAVGGFLWLQELGLRLRREEHRAWWAGSGRDLLNLAGLVALAWTLRLLGYSWPAALLVGGTLTLLLFGASVLVATQLEVPHPRAWSMGAGLALALPRADLPGPAGGRVRRGGERALRRVALSQRSPDGVSPPASRRAGSAGTRPLDGESTRAQWRVGRFRSGRLGGSMSSGW